MSDVSFRLAAPRQRPSLPAVVFLVGGLCFLVVAGMIELTGSASTQGEMTEGICLTSAAFLLVMALGALRAHRSGVAVARRTADGTTFPAAGSTRWWLRHFHWICLPAAVQALRAFTTSARVDDSILWLGLGASLIGMAFGLLVLRRRPEPPVLGPWIALAPAQITVSINEQPTTLTWAALHPATGAFPLRSAFAWPSSGLENTSASDPQVLAVAIEHFRTHPGDRHLLTDPERTARHLETLYPR